MSKEGMAQTTAGHNSAARGQVIKDIIHALDEVDSRIAELSEERKRIKGRIKSDLGEKVSDFNVLRRFYALEQEPRDQLFDLLKEGFGALGIGQQLNFIDAMEQEEAPPPPKAEKTRRARKAKEPEHSAPNLAAATFAETCAADDAGAKASQTGIPRDANPFVEGDSLHTTWDLAWLRGRPTMQEDDSRAAE